MAKSPVKSRSTGITYACFVNGKRLDFFAYCYWSNEPDVLGVERLEVYHNSRSSADGKLIGHCHYGCERELIARYIVDQIEPTWSGRIAVIAS